MEITTIIIGIIIGAYLIGSIPFGLVLCKLAGYGDIRDIGSGNIGATNVLRTGNKPLALATLLLDSGKGAAVVFITAYLTNYNFDICLMAAFAALVGHLFPVWLKFKGGKGVATTLGTLLALAPWTGMAACVLWFLTALIFRVSSLAALVGIGLTPLISHILYSNDNLSGFCGIVALLVYFKHRENIKRLFKGEEPKIHLKKRDAV